MYRILVPVDGSPNALVGVRHALQAGRPDAEIWLANVQPRLHRYVTRFVSRHDAWEARVDRGRAALREARALVESTGLVCRSAVLRGEPAAELARFAREQRVDEIVVGTSRSSGLLRFLTGSITNRLVELADVPVAVIAGGRPNALRRYGIPAGVGAGIAALLLAVE